MPAKTVSKPAIGWILQQQERRKSLDNMPLEPILRRNGQKNASFLNCLPLDLAK